jgi:hypothetical protein
MITTVDEIISAIPITSSIDGNTNDVITLVAKEVGSSSGTPNLVYSFSWIEIR